MALTVLFMPESAYGPTNQCMGLGDLLIGRGHRVVFAAESSWRGRLEPYGFEERLVDLAAPVEGASDDAGRFWTEFIAETAPEFRKPTIEQLSTFVAPTYQALIDGARFCEQQLRSIIDDVRPDVVVEDNVVTFPALMTSSAPWVRIVSCNPLEIPGEALPPRFSGYPADDASDWPAYLAEFERTHRAMWIEFNDWVQEQGAPPLPYLEFIHTSTVANLYVYPAEADYVDRRPLDDRWQRMDSSVRGTDAPWTVPDSLEDGDGGLIYLSLGSLGAADVSLMQRLVDLLAETRHRVIVSMGPRADQLTLGANMTGAAMLPQTSIIPQVDLVITHGGNNTTTETLHFGKPMIVLPLFWDQYDNAQRVAERGFGRRLPTYSFSDNEFLEAVDALLADAVLRERMQRLGAAIRARNGLQRGADAIETAGRSNVRVARRNLPG
jgi:MGT family glycosyltransferase